MSARAGGWWRRWERPLKDRLSEPLHLNLLSALVRIAGGFRLQVEFDLVERRRYAFALLQAADWAVRFGVPRICALEFGIAAGAGLVNLARLAQRVTRETGVRIDIIGFDTGTGMPEPVDYQDYPEEFQRGDFPTTDRDALARLLPPGVRVIYGPIAETARGFIDNIDAPVGFISFDLAFHSSTVDAMQVLRGPATRYLPIVSCYVGGIMMDTANPDVGELLAIREFNASSAMRKLHPMTWLRERRVFKNAFWHRQIYTFHVHDHPLRSPAGHRARATRLLEDPTGASAPTGQVTP
ncbi:MAG: hypothetical protein DIU62_002885 [Pseudomonadota bacterium]|jgi:hypothetical protein|nr:MAG: hypothetical protein DIU62_10065 [Pseudomonadota bacterium]